MATQPPLPDRTDPIDPTIPGELPPVITPAPPFEEPDGLPEVGPDQDSPESAPIELPPPD